jgi:hypothetical protein
MLNLVWTGAGVLTPESPPCNLQPKPTQTPDPRLSKKHSRAVRNPAMR